MPRQALARVSAESLEGLEDALAFGC
ncbi:MAG: hypothetical protein QOD48_1833, partial [Gaiellaceae bacterium]|nr:hypothetical protein [Gaiellaceae bacterium]